ncbi:predicted protein [Chaetomium globosum CBS 148.51]|uniref:Uncharacterized protein n=1 Tax=Chaetomium globosum (strain ATCC 6205 / CBS 148.51 / DSM 1962 / NBRC 6347 / NRRL 1970) TaxID=306901 RepID=Q2GX51_CHAGB|nr:uncharacterized protein CHGG_07453 [Chaetomium globosum CBS 148.51]EAQ86200.1 predicted protein [Chaetomium globosum CBS 148.51]
MSTRGGSPPPPPPPAEAVATWQGIFSEGPYTALKMVEYILQAGGQSVPNFVANPVETVKDITKTQIVDKHDLNQMRPVWASKTGRCTSFAVKATAILSQKVDAKKKPVYNFATYDLAGHRVARCLKTEVVIDSSSTTPGGAFVLPEGQWKKFEKTEASWKFKSEPKSKSKFERDGNPDGKVAAAYALDSPAQAMYLCLAGVEAGVKYGIPTLFRSISPQGQPLYHGMVSWMPYKRCIELVPNISKEKKKQKLVIQWGKTKAGAGTDADLEKCVNELEQFIKNYGGPNGPEQWEADGINEFSDYLFAAAVELWGNPKLVNKMTPTA